MRAWTGGVTPRSRQMRSSPRGRGVSPSTPRAAPDRPGSSRSAPAEPGGPLPSSSRTVFGTRGRPSDRRNLRPALRPGARGVRRQLRPPGRTGRRSVRDRRRTRRRRPVGRPCRRGPSLGAGHARQRLLHRQGAHRPRDRPADGRRATRRGRPRRPLLAGVRKGRERGRDRRAPAQPPGRAARAAAADASRRDARPVRDDRSAGGAGAVVAAGDGARLSRQHVRVPGGRGRPPRHRTNRGRTAAGGSGPSTGRRRAHRLARLRTPPRRRVRLARGPSRGRPVSQHGRGTAHGVQRLLQPGWPVRNGSHQHGRLEGGRDPLYQRARDRPGCSARLQRTRRRRRAGRSKGGRRGRTRRGHHRAVVRTGPGAAPAVAFRPGLPAHPAGTAARPRSAGVRPLRQPAARSASAIPAPEWRSGM